MVVWVVQFVDYVDGLGIGIWLVVICDVFGYIGVLVGVFGFGVIGLCLWCVVVVYGVCECYQVEFGVVNNWYGQVFVGVILVDIQ